MSMFWAIVLFALGLALIIKGGDVFVDAASWAAEISGIPKFIIGATVVSFATTLPELLVSVFAAFDGKVDMAIGNAVGSVTANTGLIMAISMLALPAIANFRSVGKKAIVLMLSAVFLVAVTFWDGKLSVVESIIMLLIFAYNMYDSIKQGKEATSERRMEEQITIVRKDAFINLAKFVLGATGIVIGADLMVDYGSEIARGLGVSEAIIGCTIVAVGTSLPELITTITAIAKKEASLSIGNIIGANVIDLTLIMPLCSILSGEALPVLGQNQILDCPACALICIVALVPVLIRQKYGRILGAVLLALYIGYLAIVISGSWLAWI